MVLGETVHSFEIDVQIRESSLRDGLIGTGIAGIAGGRIDELEDHGYTTERISFDANSNQNLCIALKANGHNASPSATSGEGLGEGLE